jgi:hypothetical protein
LFTLNSFTHTTNFAEVEAGVEEVVEVEVDMEEVVDV